MLTVREKFIAYYVAVVTSGVCKKRSRSEITSKLSELRNSRNRDISNAEAHKIATSVTAHIAYVFENNSEISDFSLTTATEVSSHEVSMANAKVI